MSVSGGCVSPQPTILAKQGTQNPDQPHAAISAGNRAPVMKETASDMV
jgi:hypothetical protein